MSIAYTNQSVVESFELEAALGEALHIFIYGCQWQGSTWLSDPTAALSAVNDAMDSITDLAFSGIQIISTLASIGTALAFAVDSPIYKGQIYLDPDEVPGLRTAIANALNTGDTGLYLTYGDIVLGSSKSGV